MGNASLYGPWLLLISLLLVFNLFSPLNFLLTQLSYSNSISDLLFNRATIVDWFLHASITLLTPIALVNFWYKKSITPLLFIACLSLSLLVDVLESIAVSHSSGVLRMQRERVYYSLVFRSLFCLPAILYLVRSRHVKKLFIR
ncbi:DUF2569 family protein [Rhodocytophaga aerolata]